MPRIKREPPRHRGEPLGLVCRKCGSHRLGVVYLRRMARGVVQRRRKCLDCGTRMTTRETAR